MLTTSAILHVRHRAGRRLRRSADQRRRPSRLHDDAIDAGRIGRPKNRAEVVRILDAVEHHDQRRPDAPRTRSSTLYSRGVVDVGDDALMDAAARLRDEHVGGDALRT